MTMLCHGQLVLLVYDITLDPSLGMKTRVEIQPTFPEEGLLMGMGKKRGTRYPWQSLGPLCDHHDLVIGHL